MRTYAVLSFVLAGAGCVGVDEPDIAQETSALLNGTPTTARPEVAKFWLPGGGSCSATMISDSTFLTAAHCIDYAPMRTGGQLQIQGVGVIDVHGTFSQGGATGPDDIAVGRLVSAVSSITPATVSNIQPSNQYLTTIGYGCVDGRNTDDCGAVDRTYITYFYNGANTYIHSKGDSGGPTFIGALNTNGEIVRVHSTHSYPSGPDVGADAVTYRTQILALSNRLNSTGVGYRSHVQSQGWQAAVENGSTSGTTGQALRLEGLQLWMEPFDTHVGWPYHAGICYQAYVQDQGWQTEVCNGELAGTVGLGKRMEAIKVRHVPALGSCASYGGPPFIPCKVAHYSVYLEGLGWQGPYTDGQTAGTTGQSRRIEAIQVSVY